MATGLKSLLRPFPPLEWLGYGLNLTSIDPFDYTAVHSSKTQVRIVDVTKDTRTHVVTIDGVEYKIPRVVGASEQHGTVSSKRLFSDGTLVVNSLHNDASLAHRLLAVTARDVSLFPLDKSLPTGNQFYFFANDHDSYSGSLRDYLDFINETALLKYISKLPPFDSKNPDAVQAYVELFKGVGSHVVANTGFGARFQLEVWGLNKYEEVSSNFNRDVSASVKGLDDGGEYDETVCCEDQYWNFNRISQRIIRIRGGDPRLAHALMDSPDFFTYELWTQSTSGNAVLVTLGTIELWTILRDADNKILRDRASDVQNAFECLSSLRKPNDNRTWAIFEMESNWGEFGILTPSAVIAGADRDELAVRQRLSLGPPKLSWGTLDSPVMPFAAVVEIINDGTPIDIYLSCGFGTASVKILNHKYVTEDGTKRFRRIPVSL